MNVNLFTGSTMRIGYNLGWHQCRWMQGAINDMTVHGCLACLLFIPQIIGSSRWVKKTSRLQLPLAKVGIFLGFITSCLEFQNILKFLTVQHVRIYLLHLHQTNFGPKPSESNAQGWTFNKTNYSDANIIWVNICQTWGSVFLLTGGNSK